MEKESSNNEPNQSSVSGAEENQNHESPIKEESKIQEEPKKLSLSDINPDGLTAKIENFFIDKLQTMESKFLNDLIIVEPYKFEFIDLYHDLEDLKQEILDFLKKEEDKKSNMKKPAGGAGAITRNNTSRSRTPVKFNATSKVTSTRDVTKSVNTKGDLDKSRSRTPLTSSKTNSKTVKDVSVSKTETKKVLNTTANTALTVNTTKVATTAKKPGIADVSAKKRDITPVSNTKTGKILETSGISHIDPAHTEHGNTAAKNPKANKSGIKGEAKENNASAVLKKPANENANISNGSKKKSALNLTSGSAAEGQPVVSSFNSSLELTAKKKSVLAGGLNSSLNADLSANYSSNNNLGESINNNGSHTARASINKGSSIGERKASLPSQRASFSGAKRNSVEGKKENLNGSIDDKRSNNNADKKNEDNNKNVNNDKRKSIEVKKIEVENKTDNDVISSSEKGIEENRKEDSEVYQIKSNFDNEKENNINKADKGQMNEIRKSINEMVFENQNQGGEKQEEVMKEEKATSDSNNNLSVNPQMEKRQSIKQESQPKNSDNLNVAEKAENDLKVIEERKKSVVSESLSNAVDESAENKIQEGLNEENTESKGENQSKISEAPAALAAPNVAKNSNSEQIIAAYCNKELVSSQSSEVKEDLFIFLKDKVAEYEALVAKYKSDITNLTIINKQLAFSKTAVNGLNFVKKEEEKNLLKKEQNEKIVDVFKFFCILLNENWETLPSNKIIEFFIITVLPKYKLESLKKFVSEYIPANILNFEIQLEKTLDFISKHHHILVSNELLSLNRSVSYITFSNKEIFEYLSAKLSDGNYAYHNRQAIGLIKKYNEILNKLGS